MPKRRSKRTHARRQKVVVLQKTPEKTPEAPIEDPKLTKKVVRQVTPQLFESLGGIRRAVVVPEPEARNEELKMSSNVLKDMTKDESLSEFLFSTLERAGVSWDIRKMHMKSVYADVTNTNSIVDYFQVRSYMFGSNAEGAFTSKQQPDVDLVYINEAIPFVENCTDITGHTDYLHVFTDSTTPPGYVKLQILRQKPFETCVFKEGKDGSGRRVITNESDHNFIKLVFPNDPFFKRSHKSGPAEKCFHRTHVKNCREPVSSDRVFGFKICTWPSYAVGWLKRKRNYNWPTSENIGHLQNLECFCVPVGHANSKEKHLEWRLSFSLQEKQLMFSLNDVQFKCYVLLKLIKTDVIAPRLGESLTSYHCKTALFYTIETNSQDIWTPENLLHCASLCLRYLLECCKTGVFPHYFIPDANLFDGKIEGNQLTQLIHVVKEILSDPLKYIQEIKAIEIGKLVYVYNTANLNVADTSELTATSHKALACRVLDLHFTTVNLILQLRMVSFKYISDCNTTQEAISRHYHVLKIVCECCSENDNKGQHRPTNIALILPYIYTSLASHIAVIAMQFGDETVRDWYICASALYFSKGLNSDLMSSRLKFATLLYIMGHWKSSELILDDIESRTDIRNDIFTSCLCRTIRFNNTDNSVTAAFINQSKEELFRKSTAEFLQTSVCACVIFLPTEMAITPYALRYEMFRSVATHPGSRHISHFWYDWAVVDAKFYIHLLRYLLDIHHPDKHTRNMSKLFTSDTEHSHQETCHNLLGWIAKINADAVTIPLGVSFNGEFGERRFTPFEMVSRAYMKSWEILLDYFREILPSGHLHNAVKWHVCVLLYEMWIEKQMK